MMPIVRKVWDNVSCTVDIPKAMGEPKAHQMCGSPWDNLAELAGRVCYDSLGMQKSRGSLEYHAHIKETKHLSVYEHCTFNVRFLRSEFPVELLLNRPGIWVVPDGKYLYITLNFRHVLEWAEWDNEFYKTPSYLLSTLQSGARWLAPMVFPDPVAGYCENVDPRTPEQMWITFYIGNVSRGLTHELVRHGDYTAISQRSTRYCDESDSPWVWHPLIRPEQENISWETRDKLHDVEVAAKDAYRAVVQDMTTRGIERKQARGAARGVLGNALSTEIIFSASLAQWRWIIDQRASVFADAEIRGVAEQIQEALEKYNEF